jgi:membrane protease YdiL (CAAX protease family)
MAGIIVELVISWLLLWFFEKKHLTALGIGIQPKRMRDLGYGLLGAAICCVVYHLLTTVHWRLNRMFTLNAIWWVLKSVLFEELAFRGALLYIAIKKLGMTKACMLSALCFGIYHVFSYGAYGNPGNALMIILITGFVGLALAYAFANTQSIYLPIGLHLGWNLINILVFSAGPLGRQLFVKSGYGGLTGIPSLLVFLLQISALPLFTALYLKMFYKKVKL